MAARRRPGHPLAGHGRSRRRPARRGAAWSHFAFPTWWHYDVLRGLDYLRAAGVAPDDRVAEAVALVASKRDTRGRWRLEACHRGTMPIELGEAEGQPSRWITLRALRVLDWYAGGEPRARGRRSAGGVSDAVDW